MESVSQKSIYFLALLACIIFTSNVSGQLSEPEKKLRELRKDSINGWQKGGVVMINFGQTSLSNWARGGENTISGNSILNFFAYYRKNTLTWDNTVDLAGGYLRQGSQGRKTDDRFEFSTKIGMEASKNWYYSGLISFRSQFFPGYNYPNDSVKISDFFAPAYIITAFGMDYKPGKLFTAFIAPLTGKITIVGIQRLADAGNFGVEPAKYEGDVKIKDGYRVRQEFGGYVRVGFQKDIMTNVNLNTKLELFSNYINNPQNVDVNWQVLLSMKINKYIGATFTTTLIYDDDVHYKINNSAGIIEDKGPRTQFMEVLGVGLSYKFKK
jgi:hypothetical protein